KAVIERCAAVGTVLAHQAVAAASIAIEQQVLTQDANSLLGLCAGELDGGGNRVPVAAQQVSGRGSGSDGGEQLILVFTEHVQRSCNKSCGQFRATICEAAARCQIAGLCFCAGRRYGPIKGLLTELEMIRK